MTTSTEQAVLPGWELTADGHLSLPCPPVLAGTARAWLTGGSSPGVDPKPAATVMLVRPGRRGMDTEVFMLRRAASMAFLAGAVVFPGGKVDPRDSESIGWCGPSAEVWGGRLGCGAEEAKAVVVAAVRELFEEGGVLLAGTGPGHVVTALDTPEWVAEVERLEAHESSLAEVLARHGLVIRSDLLSLRGHWVTPEFEPRRYDTYFFAAVLPEGQETYSTTTEADADRWVRPRTVLEAAAEGRLGLFPPTAHTLAQLAGCESAHQFVHEDVVIERLMLVPIERQDGDVVLFCRLPSAPGNPARAGRSAIPEKEVSLCQ